MTKRDAAYYEEKARRQRIQVGENIVDDLYCATARAYDLARDLGADPAAVELIEDVLGNLHEYRRPGAGVLTPAQVQRVGRRS